MAPLHLYTAEVVTRKELYVLVVYMPPVPAAPFNAVDRQDEVQAVSKSQVASATPCMVLEHGSPGYVKDPPKSASGPAAAPHAQVDSAGRPQPRAHVPAHTFEQTALDEEVQAIK